jgi:hypothetical protein
VVPAPNAGTVNVNAITAASTSERVLRDIWICQLHPGRPRALRNGGEGVVRWKIAHRALAHRPRGPRCVHP